MIDCISFVLFGDDPKYFVGLAKNVELARSLYPGWVCRVYTDLYLPDLGAEVFRGTEKPNRRQRFRVAMDPNVRRFIVRDCDSRLTPREQAAVAAWIDSGKQFHVMRDHPMHMAPVMGGMWGGCVTQETRMRLLSHWTPTTASMNLYGSDQEFLAEHWWPIIKEDCLQHDSCLAEHNPGAVPFPNSECPPERFVGEVFDEHEQPDGGWKQRMEYLNGR